MASLADAFMGIESSGNPLAWNTLPGGRRSRYRGLFQFGPDQERRYGITDDNWTDPAVQRGAFEQHIGSLRGDLGRRLGRQPEDWELYFGHQQGPSGSHALLTAAPGTPAWQAIRRFYGSDALAQQAISGNIPRGHALYGRPADSITAQDFAQMWRGRFGRQGGPGSRVAGAPFGAPTASPLLGAGMGGPSTTAAPASDTGASWLSRIGSGLGSAFGIGSAEAQTPPVVEPTLSPDGRTRITLPPYGGVTPPPIAPPAAETPPGGPPLFDLQRLLPPPAETLGGPPGLSGAAPPPTPPVGPPELRPDSPLLGTLGPPTGPQSPGGLPSVQQLLGGFVPAGPSAASVAPFGAPTVTPEPGSFGHPMGPSELQPGGRDITREMVGAGLPQAQPPPVDADAIVRGAEGAAADRASQAPRPFSISDLASNPMFLAGLSILGTAPGGNWGPNAAQAMTAATRAGREETEWQRLQRTRATQDRVWREAFGTNGQPVAGHPLLAGMPPEMAATIYAMGAEEGLPAAQRWQMFRGQRQEAIREREHRAEIYGMGPPQAPPQAGGDGLSVLTGDRLRRDAGLGGLPGGPSADDDVLRTAPVAGLTPRSVPGAPGFTAAPTAAPGAPPPVAPPGGGRDVPVTIGRRTLPASQWRAFATGAPDGERHVIEQAIAAAEREAQPPDAIRTRALTADQSFRTISGALGDYVRLVEGAGMSGASWPGATRDAVVRSRTNLLLQLKEMYNLGVLNGPDLALMESMIPDPTISVGNVVGQGSVAERARRAADQLRRELERVRANALGAAGMQAPDGGSGQQPPGGRFRYNPSTGQLEPAS